MQSFLKNIGRKTAVISFLLVCGYFPFTSTEIYGRAEDESLQKKIDKITKDPVIRELMKRGEKPALTPVQKRILEGSIDSMKPEEVDSFLKELNLSREGSIYLKKERLKMALEVAVPPDLPEEPSQSAIAIENASEGEYMQGKEDERGLLKLKGRIRLRVPSGVFHADSVIVDTKLQEIYAEGNLTFKGPDSDVTAERLIYNQKLQTGIMYNAEGYNKPVYFVGQNLMSLDKRRVALSHVRFTSCAAERPHYDFTARKVWIYDGRRIVAVGVVYRIGGVPLLPLPFIFASDWGTGIISQIGSGKLQGFFMQNTYQFGIPEAVNSSWAPQYYRFKLDYYQNTGKTFGTELYKFSSSLNYLADLNVAKYRRYEIVTDYRDPGSFHVTNNVLKGTNPYTGYPEIGEDNYTWHKAFVVLNSKKSEPEKNHVRNIYLRYENYSHQLFDYEFGGRYQPESTIPALYENSESGRGLLHPTTDWDLVYSEQWDGFSLRLEASRKQLWLENANFSESRYVPVHDTVPSFDLTKRFSLGQLPLFDSPVFWNHAIHSDLTKVYDSGKKFQTVNTNRYTNDFSTFISYYPYITFRPLVGYGVQKLISKAENPAADDSLDRLAKRNSYEYFYSENEVVVGPEYLFLRALHRKKDTFKEELPDTSSPNINAYEDSQKVNETEVGIETYPFSNLLFSITSIYDHRKFPNDVSERERWRYPVARLDWTIDFLNYGRRSRENLLSRKRLHFLMLNITNDYVYDYAKDRDHSNLLGLSFQAGGFDLWLLKRLRFFEMSFYWYHVYFDQKLDHMRFTMKGDIQLTKHLFLELQLESMASGIERYSHDSLGENGESDHVNFENDIVNGTGASGPEKRQKAAFNLGYFECALLMDLHDWEMRVGYSIEQKSILTTSGSLDVVNFYDNKVFFSLTLLRFDIAGASDRPSRFIINRRRVRGSDIGRMPVGYR